MNNETDGLPIYERIALLENDINVETEYLDMLTSTYVQYTYGYNEINDSDSLTEISNESLELLSIDVDTENFKDILEKTKQALKELWDMILDMLKGLIKKVKELVGLNSKRAEKIDVNIKAIKDIEKKSTGSTNKAMVNLTAATVEVVKNTKTSREPMDKLDISSFKSLATSKLGIFIVKNDSCNTKDLYTNLENDMNNIEDVLSVSYDSLEDIYKNIIKDKNISLQKVQDIKKKATNSILKSFDKGGLVVNNNKLSKLILDVGDTDVAVVDYTNFNTSGLLFNKDGNVTSRTINFKKDDIIKNAEKIIDKVYNGSADKILNIATKEFDDYTKIVDNLTDRFKKTTKTIENNIKTFENNLNALDISARLTLDKHTNIKSNDILNTPNKAMYVILFRELALKAFASNSKLFSDMCKAHLDLTNKLLEYNVSSLDTLKEEKK